MRARLCITDLPFNVRVKGYISSGDHAEFAMASGEMTSGEFIDFLRSAPGFVIDCTIDGGLHFVFRCCQSKANQSQKFAGAQVLGSDQFTLFEKGGIA